MFNSSGNSNMVAMTAVQHELGNGVSVIGAFVQGRELEVDISARNHRLVLCRSWQRCWMCVAVLVGTSRTITGWVRGSQCFHAVVRGPGFVLTTFSKEKTPTLCRGCFSTNCPRPSFLLPHATKTRWWPAPAT